MAVDPGGTTGWCLWDDEAPAPLAAEDQPYDFLRKAHLLLQRDDADRSTVVCERFVITAATAKKSQQPDALHQIGALGYLARYEAGLDVHFQNPADVMRLATDERLRKLGWYVPGKGHANDALRHLAVWCAKSGRIELPL